MYYGGVAGSRHRRLRSTKSEVNQGTGSAESGARQSSLGGVTGQEGDPAASSGTKWKSKLPGRGQPQRPGDQQAEDAALARWSDSNPPVLAQPSLIVLLRAAQRV